MKVRPSLPSVPARVALALLLVLGACGKPEPSAPTPPPGPAAQERPAPPRVADMPTWDLDGLRGAIRTSGAELTVVALWATWCTPCIEEMPLLEAFANEHREAGVRVIGLSTDDPEMMGERMEEIFERTGVHYPQAFLRTGGEDAFFSALGERWDGMLPKTLLFDAEGKMLRLISEAVTEEVLASKVVPLIGARP